MPCGSRLLACLLAKPSHNCTTLCVVETSVECVVNLFGVLELLIRNIENT